MSDRNEQRAVTELLLASIGKYGFVLAGSGAIREHGLINRPTEDVDVFTVVKYADSFDVALDTGIVALSDAGYQVTVGRRSSSFANLTVSRDPDIAVSVDLGVDWRAHPPVTLSVGPVLNELDAVGNKVAALFSRGEARDYLDVAFIRASGKYTDEQLVEMAKNADPGFDTRIFAHRIIRMELTPRERFAPYIDTAELGPVMSSMAEWGKKLLTPVTREDIVSRITNHVSKMTQTPKASFPPKQMRKR